MGTDFIEKAAPSFKKSWDKSRVKLYEATLLNTLPTDISRSFSVSLLTAAAPNLSITIEREAGALVVRSGLTALGRCDAPPQPIAEFVERNFGIAPGVILEIHEISGEMDVQLCMPPDKNN